MARRIAALLAILLPAGLPAQRSDTTAIPRELAVALISSGDFGFDGRDPQIVVGRLTDERLTPVVPRGARIIGGVTFGSRDGASRSIAILAMREPADSVLTVLESSLKAAGLKLAPSFEDMRNRDGGFVSTIGFGGRMARGIYYCGDVGSVSATATSAATGSTVRLTTQDVRNTMCDSTWGARFRESAREQVQLPTLRPPLGVTSHSSGSGGSEDSREAHASLSGTVTPAALLDHFADQLREQGWTLINRLADGDLSALSARKADAQGQPMHLMLTDHRMDSREHEVSVRVSRRNRYR